MVSEADVENGLERATEPTLILNIQSRDQASMILTGVSVNDNPRCFPEYKMTGNKDLDGFNGLNMVMMNLVYMSKGISTMKDGYSKELKLGEVERIGLGSPKFGGCVPVKVTVTTDRSTSTFYFE